MSLKTLFGVQFLTVAKLGFRSCMDVAEGLNFPLAIKHKRWGTGLWKVPLIYQSCDSNRPLAYSHISVHNAYSILHIYIL